MSHQEPLFSPAHTCSLPVDRPSLTSGTRWTCECGAVYVFVDSWKDRQRVRQWMPTRCPHCHATNVLEPRPSHCSHDWHTWRAA